MWLGLKLINKEFIHLGAALLWKPSNDAKLYIIGVLSTIINKDCDSSNFTTSGLLVFNYIGWILEQVEGGVCGTWDKIDDWFDEKDHEKKQNKTKPTAKLVNN